MKTKKQTDDVEMAVAKATRILVDANVDFCVVGVDESGVLSTGMSPTFGAACKRVKIDESNEESIFRTSYLMESLGKVADALTGCEIEHRRQYGIPMVDGFDND
jgi:hypothetical protein